MRRFFLLCLLVHLFGSGCGLQEREQAIKKREEYLSEKEQQLLLKENELALREEDLSRRQKMLDSVVLADTGFVYNPQLIGTWNVKMTCTETTCPGSAIGDTKTESWDFIYQGRNLVAKAMVGDKLVRVYSGTSMGDKVTLTEDVTKVVPGPTAKMHVQLTRTGEMTMEGQREIFREENNCKIIYRLQMSKR